MEHRPDTRLRIASLDGWRAIAITLVLFSHAWATEGASHSAITSSLLARQGSLGVRIFFTLSGFLITRLLLDEYGRSERISLRAFYMRRIYRIFPVYYLFLATLGIAQLAGVYDDAGTTWLGALTFTRNLLGQGDSATGHLWSLAVEEQFYLLWPVAMMLLNLPQRRTLAFGLLALGIAAGVLARTVDCQTAGFLCRTVFHPSSALRAADCMAIGCLGAFVHAGWQPTARMVRPIAPIAALLLAVSALAGPGLGRWSSTLLVDAQAWLTIVAMITSAAAGRGLWFGFLNARPVAFIGLISYSLYIWHMLFLRHYVGLNFPLGPMGNWRIWWLAAIGLATLSYFAFERPIVRAGGRWRR